MTLKNSLNHPADFTWSPILSERGTAFSIRPATGSVEAGTDLDCEVVFHPSYLAPENGEFLLQVHGGNTLRLKCTAMVINTTSKFLNGFIMLMIWYFFLSQLGQPTVNFIDRRVNFGQVPLHLTTTRTAMFRNTGLCHAYFQVKKTLILLFKFPVKPSNCL